MMDSDLKKRFLSDISNLREAYPMVCVRFWTPDDFAEAAAPGTEGDWEDPVNNTIAKHLGGILDEDSGSNWLKMRRAMRAAEGGV